MPPLRLFGPADEITVNRTVTLLLGEREYEGAWMHPHVPALVYNTAAPGSGPVTIHPGGDVTVQVGLLSATESVPAVGSGLPVLLVFWGSFWQTAEGGSRRAQIDDRVQRMIASRYFSELAQYGVAPPTFLGSQVVAQPAPPMAFANEDNPQELEALMDGLVRDGVVPDPDIQPVACVVLMPKGFTSTANGAHDPGFDTATVDGFLWPIPDVNFRWVAWIHFDPDHDNTSETISHELVELFTNPQNQGWFSNTPNPLEIADSADTPGGFQTAFVNGARVSAYWSNNHGATIVPIDQDYRARIVADVTTVPGSRYKIDEGTFRPDDRDRLMCGFVDVCCVEDRPYGWWIHGHDETATLTVETGRYRTPQATWSVNGRPVAGGGVLENLPVGAAHYNGRSLEQTNALVDIAFQASDTQLTLRTQHTNVNFDLDVRCSVHDGSIAPNKAALATDVVATPDITIGFVGSELTIDPAYESQADACEAWLSGVMKDIGRKQKVATPKPGDPVMDPGVLAGLPAWTRIRRFERVRRALALAEAARRALPEPVAQALTARLHRDVPELALRAAPGREESLRERAGAA